MMISMFYYKVTLGRTSICANLDGSYGLVISKYSQEVFNVYDGDTGPVKPDDSGLILR